MLPDFALVRPGSVDEATAVLDEDHVPISGGTELLLAMSMGMMAPVALVDVTRIPELRRLETENPGRSQEVAIGSGMTHREVHRHPGVRAKVPMLAKVTGAIGNARVRAQGSVGGNLCFAEPKSDLTTALIALDADVVLAGPSGRRRLPMATFVEGPYTTAREDTELLVEVRIRVRPSRRALYLKFQTMERPTVGVAAVADDDRVRIAVGAVGPMPIYRDFASVSEVDVDAIVADVEPLPDLAGSEEYKRHLTRHYVRAAVEGLS